MRYLHYAPHAEDAALSHPGTEAGPNLSRGDP
jgi:hypothetical protein